MERLDRSFVNKEWLFLFPKAVVIHLPKTHSDYKPLLIKLIPRNVNHSINPFRLKTIWCRHSDFINIVKHCWNDNDLVTTQSSFKDKVIKWKNDTFGDIFKKKKRILARLNFIQSSSSFQSSLLLQELESKLQLEYNNILKNGAWFLELRYRINWLNEGDANTKYYHIMASNRKRRNAIMYFTNDNGDWISDPKQILDHTLFFLWRPLRHPKLSPIKMQSWVIPYAIRKSSANYPW